MQDCKSLNGKSFTFTHPNVFNTFTGGRVQENDGKGGLKDFTVPESWKKDTLVCLYFDAPTSWIARGSEAKPERRNSEIDMKKLIEYYNNWGKKKNVEIIYVAHREKDLEFYTGKNGWRNLKSKSKC